MFKFLVVFAMAAIVATSTALTACSSVYGCCRLAGDQCDLPDGKHTFMFGRSPCRSYPQVPTLRLFDGSGNSITVCAMPLTVNGTACLGQPFVSTNSGGSQIIDSLHITPVNGEYSVEEGGDFACITKNNECYTGITYILVTANDTRCMNSGAPGVSCTLKVLVTNASITLCMMSVGAAGNTTVSSSSSVDTGNSTVSSSGSMYQSFTVAFVTATQSLTVC